MSKSVLISIQPYYVFLIIAKTTGWDIPQEKTIEVRKTIPKDKDWDKKAIIYCSKNKKSFAKIPKEYQSLMKQYLGKVIGEFVCKAILPISITYSDPNSKIALREFPFTCLTDKEIMDYLGNGNIGYGLCISDLVIYDKLRELGEFKKINRDCCYSAFPQACRQISVTAPARIQNQSGVCIRLATRLHG